MWAVAESGVVPNSLRSPPEQNASPAPLRMMPPGGGAGLAARRAFTRWSRISALKALRRSGRLRVRCRVSVLSSVRTAGLSSVGTAGWSGAGDAVACWGFWVRSQFWKTWPPCSME